MNWHFNRIPDEHISTVVKSFQKRDFNAITEIYKRYRVIPTGVCDTCNESVIIAKATAYAVERLWANTSINEDKKAGS